MISKEWLEYYQKKFNGKNEDCISYRPDGFEIIKKDLEILDNIKLLAKKYNNGELGYINFTQEVIELL